MFSGVTWQLMMTIQQGNFQNAAIRHTFACISKKVWSLLTIKQRVCLAQDERIQKEGNEKKCFPG